MGCCSFSNVRSNGGPLEVEEVCRAGVAVAAHASDCTQFGGIDAKVIDNRVVDVESHRFTQYQRRSHRAGANGDDLEKLALHLHTGLLDARRFDEVAGNWSKP